MTDDSYDTAITEFSVDIDLPDFIFKGPAVREMTEALFDMTVWANVSAPPCEFIFRADPHLL